MTTKQEEREALDMIRKILGNLDSDGYLNTAFEGVLEIAQSNIENDFACSLMQRVESLEEQLDNERALRKEYFGKLCAAEKNAETAAAKAQAEMANMAEALRESQKKQIPQELHTKIYAAVLDREQAAIDNNREAADAMAEFADAPQDIAFRSAVDDYKHTKFVIADCERILAELDRINPFNK